MGRDKALLPWRSRPLVESVAEAVKQAAGNVTLIGEPERYEHLSFAAQRDAHPSLGPVGGIQTALKLDLGELNLIVACDMPGVNPRLLTGLLTAAEQNGGLCTYVEDRAGRSHPLCAVYRKECLLQVEDAIADGRFRALDLVKDLGAVPLVWPEVLANVNTPSEWECWRDDA